MTMIRARDVNCVKVTYSALGVGANTNIAISGIATEDTLIFVGKFITAAAIASLTDITSTCSITSAGNIQCTASTEAGGDAGLFVVWDDNDGAKRARDVYNLKFAVLAGVANAATDITVTGLATEDEVIFCGQFTTAAAIATITDITTTLTITATDTMRSSATTVDDTLLFVWNDLNPGSGSSNTARDSICLKVSVLAGTTATTNIAVTDIATEDQILWCGHLTTAAAIITLEDKTSEVSVTSAGNIQLASTSTATDALWLWWIDVSA